MTDHDFKAAREWFASLRETEAAPDNPVSLAILAALDAAIARQEAEEAVDPEAYLRSLPVGGLSEATEFKSTEHRRDCTLCGWETKGGRILLPWGKWADICGECWGRDIDAARAISQ